MGEGDVRGPVAAIGGGARRAITAATPPYNPDVHARTLRGLVALAALLVAVHGQEGAPIRPNVVLFLVDDMGWMDCGAYGSTFYETPNIDRFAQRAVRFSCAYGSPLCSPSRASLLTGKYPTRHGILLATGHEPPQPANFDYLPDRAPAEQAFLHPLSKNFLEPAEITLAEALRDGGYRTALIGKAHLGLTPPYWPDQQGFDVAWHCHPDSGPPSYFSPYGVVPEARERTPGRLGTITDGPPGEYIVDRQADEATRFIAANRDRPFFLFLSCFGVHGPWGHKPEYTAKFAARSDPRGVQGNPIMAAMLQSVDECFGRILAALDEHGLTGETLVLFCSDNGGNVESNAPSGPKTEKAERNKPEMLADWRKWAGDRPPTSNAPLRAGKGSLYEGGTRVPMLWSWPGHIPPGRVSDEVVGLIDVYPTLLALLGLSVPAGQEMDGVSLAPLLTGEGPLAPRAFFNYLPHQPKYEEAPSAGDPATGVPENAREDVGGVTVVSGGLKLVRWFHPDLPSELYDLRADLGETRNLAAEQPEAVRALDALLDGFLRDTGALVPRPNPDHTRDGTPGDTPPGAEADPLGGWIAKSARAEFEAGKIRLTSEGRTPMLTILDLEHPGPIEVHLRRRGAGGSARLQWRTADQGTFPSAGQAIEFALEPSAQWTETEVELPVTGTLVHLRLFLPLQSGTVELDWVRIDSASGGQQLWEFGGPAR